MGVSVLSTTFLKSVLNPAFNAKPRSPLPAPRCPFPVLGTSVCIACNKQERGWENSRRLCKPETKSRVCITVENSPNPSCVYIRLYRQKVFYCFYKITSPRKKRKTLCMTLIKREILTSRKILSTKSCTRNQFLLCKKMLCKIRIFLA